MELEFVELVVAAESAAMAEKLGLDKAAEALNWRLVASQALKMQQAELEGQKSVEGALAAE